MSKPLKNTPSLWRREFPQPSSVGNKYDRGYCVVLGGPLHSAGAAKLAARGALRVGAGLVSIACDKESLPVYAASLQAIMTKPVDSAAAFKKLIADKHVVSLLLGPGAGMTERTKSFVLKALASRKSVVLDADALSVFAQSPKTLFKTIKSSCIMTPHEGEFKRLFGTISGSRVQRALKAAALSGAVIVLKGSETVVAAPDGRVAVNSNATPYLATAGSGDVLAGMCAGFLAQGMETFKAACAAVWLHAEAGRAFGPGLIAEDIPEMLPACLRLVGKVTS